MPLRFRTQAQRDELSRRLTDLAIAMIRSRDQGHDGRITVTDEVIADLRTAAYLVGCAEVCDPEMPDHVDGQRDANS